MKETKKVLVLGFYSVNGLLLYEESILMEELDKHDMALRPQIALSHGPVFLELRLSIRVQEGGELMGSRWENPKNIERLLRDLQLLSSELTDGSCEVGAEIPFDSASALLVETSAVAAALAVVVASSKES